MSNTGKIFILDEIVLHDLRVEVTLKEVRQSIFSMNPLKAPGVDRLHASSIKPIGIL